jgi:hypothetical protein
MSPMLIPTKVVNPETQTPSIPTPMESAFVRKAYAKNSTKPASKPQSGQINNHPPATAHARKNRVAVMGAA